MNRLPDELWFLITPFLNIRDLLTLTTLSSHIREAIYNSPAADKITCFATHKDKTEENKAKKKHLNLYPQGGGEYTYSISRARDASVRFFTNDTISKDFQISIGNSTLKTCYSESNLDWKVMNSRIKESFDLWRTNANAKHYIFCSLTPNSGQHLVLNKILRGLGETDPYNQALPGVRQVLQTKSGDDTVLINTISTPLLFAKQQDGFNRVDGVIYVVDTSVFPATREQVYRHLHDTLGEYHYREMNCWVIFADEENVTVQGSYKAQPWDEYLQRSISSLVVGSNLSPFAEEMARSLKLTELQTCSWYYSARCVITNTESESLQAGFLKFTKQPRVRVEDIDDGTMVLGKREPVRIVPPKKSEQSTCTAM